jgi:hypothetical protein
MSVPLFLSFFPSILSSSSPLAHRLRRALWPPRWCRLARKGRRRHAPRLHLLRRTLRRRHALPVVQGPPHRHALWRDRCQVPGGGDGTWTATGRWAAAKQGLGWMRAGNELRASSCSPPAPARSGPLTSAPPPPVPAARTWAWSPAPRTRSVHAGTRRTVRRPHRRPGQASLTLPLPCSRPPRGRCRASRRTRGVAWARAAAAAPSPPPSPEHCGLLLSLRRGLLLLLLGLRRGLFHPCAVN